MNGKNEFNFKDTFPPLGHPEHHFNKYQNHPWLKTKEDIESWIKKDLIKYNKLNHDIKFEIHNDLTVDIELNYQEVEILDDFIPIQFRYTGGAINIKGNFKKLIGVPYNCSTFYCLSSKIKDLEGIPYHVKNIGLSNNNLKNFKFMKGGEFKLKNVALNVISCPIESWDGFEGEDVDLVWWQNSFQHNSSMNLLLNKPKGVKTIRTGVNFKLESLNYIEYDKNLSTTLDMEWLNEEIEKYREVADLKEEIDTITSDENCSSKKKRKI